MTATNPPPLFDCCRAGVAELLDAHADFDVVERTIDTYALGREEKDALWLWASARRRPVAAPDRRPAVHARNWQPSKIATTAGEGHD
jgi:hypothetical protein